LVYLYTEFESVFIEGAHRGDLTPTLSLLEADVPRWTRTSRRRDEIAGTAHHADVAKIMQCGDDGGDDDDVMTKI
jgi:hypothetical protein